MRVLAGQKNLNIIPTALGTTTDSTFANYMLYGQAGTAANAIATNATRMLNLTKAGFPANLLVANPTVARSGAYVLTNDGSSYYNAPQIEGLHRTSMGFTTKITERVNFESRAAGFERVQPD